MTENLVEHYQPVFDSVAAWAAEPLGPLAFPTEPSQYLEPLITHAHEHYPFEFNYYIRGEALDPLVPDLRRFFDDMHEWLGGSEGWFGSKLDYIKAGIVEVYTEIVKGLRSLATKIKDEIIGLYNFMGNVWDWIKLHILHDIWSFAADLFKPITDAWFSVTTTLETWFKYIWEAITNFWADPEAWLKEQISDLWDWLDLIRDMIWEALVSAADIVGGYIGSKLQEFAPVVVEYLRDVLIWLWDTIKTGFLFVVETVVPAVWEATSGALGWVKDEFTNLVGLAYDEFMEKATSLVPVTPERSAGIAAGMFGSAVGFGVMAHTMALAVETVPNLKYMGVHYLSAFVARMGSFGTISSATMGVIAALAIKEPFTYYMNSILRPAIPDEKLLIEFRAKREFGYEAFKGYMKYHGYTDEWIKFTDSWLWKDPRLFEILYCADVTVPPKEWLQRKFERAGYEDIDIDTLIKVVERRTTRSPRTYYTTSLRRNFRHGFLSEEELVEGINALEMAPDAIDWIKRAGELDNIYEVNSDWVTAFKTAFRNDILTEDELSASLTAIGLPWDRVEAITELEFVRKQPRILEAERKEIETQWREVQGKYSKVYIESFRRGLITEVQLVSYLVAIGIKPKVAAMTARHEVIKLVPKPKPEAIPVPVIPLPPEPPTYED